MAGALIGTRKGLVMVVDRAGRLEVAGVHFLGVPVSAVLVDERDGTVYAALDHGHFGTKLHRSNDRGATFDEIASPAYPPRPDDADDVDPMRQTPIPWSTELVWELAAGHADEPGLLYAGTIPGGLFRSFDRGDSWELLRSLWDLPERRKWFGGRYDLPGIHSVSVDPRGPGRVLVGVSCGGAWRSDDGTESWAVATGMRAGFMPPDLADDPAIQDPHRLARCRAEPDVVWCQHHSGCFCSTDGGSTFNEIVERPPSTFGFAVAAHPTDPQTAWFVPATSDEVRVPVDARLVVSRTGDGGRTFDVLGRGLPDRNAYDLVYRHALDVDDRGERLLMGSTTGSLWWSDDGGDEWHTVGGHCPRSRVCDGRRPAEPGARWRGRPCGEIRCRRTSNRCRRRSGRGCRAASASRSV